MISISKLTKRADKLWSEVVKLTFGNKCFLCKYRPVQLFSSELDAHHLVKRGELRYRFNPLNGVALCRIHHSLIEDGKIDLMPYVERYLRHHYQLVSNAVRKPVLFPREHIEVSILKLKQLKKDLR